MANSAEQRMKEIGDKALAALRKNKKIVVAIAAAAGVGLLALAIVPFFAKDAAYVYEEIPVLVSVEEVQPTGHNSYLTYAGIVQPETIEQTTPTVVAVVEELLVEEGDIVTKGQVIARLDDEDARTSVDASKNVMDSAASAKDNAASALKRAKDNHNKASAPASAADIADAKADLADSESRRDAKQAEYDKADAQYQADAAYEELLRARYDAVKDYESKKSAFDTAKAKLLATGSDEDKKALYGADANGDPLDETNYSADSVYGQYAAAKKTAAESCGCSEDAIPASSTLYSEFLDARSVSVSGLSKRSTLAAELETLNAEVEADKLALQQLEEQGSESGNAEAAKTALESAQAAYDDASIAYENAKAGYERASAALKDYEVRAGQDGYVVMVVATEGSTATPLAPIVVIGSHSSVVNFGISQTDVRSISVGDKATVTVSGRELTGEVKAIGTMPDETSRTYSTDVSVDLSADSLLLGETASVRINVGEKKGAWLPISVILHDGEDYVFVVVNNRIQRRNVVLSELSNDFVLVEGLAAGDLVVKEGLSLVRAGSLVEIAG